MAIKLIKQKVAIGSKLHVVLKTGQEMHGVLVEIEDDYLMLKSSSGDCFLTDDSISAWQVITVSEESTDINNPRKTPQQTASLPSDQSQTGFTIKPQTTVLGSSDNPGHKLDWPVSNSNYVTNTGTTDIIRKEISITEGFKAAIKNLFFEPLPPNFIIQIDENFNVSYRQKDDIRKEFERQKNRYEYALKIKELSRLNQSATELSDLLQKYPFLGRGWYCLGCLYLQLGKDFDAAHAFELAIAHSPDPEPCYNLFVIYFRRKELAKEYNALGHLFSRSSISKYKMAWYRFVDLASYYLSIDKLTALLKKVFDSNNLDDTYLLIESITYFLITCGKPEEARSIIPYLSQDHISAQDSDAIEKILVRLKVDSASLMYARQQKELLESQERLTRIQEDAEKQRKVLGLLAGAEDLSRQGKYLLAIAEVDKALQIDPGNTKAKQQKQVYFDQSKPRTIVNTNTKASIYRETKKATTPLPSGGGYYAKGKRAQLAEGNLTKAVEFMKLAIEQGDNAESAVKDLASIYQQLGKTKEGITLLKDYLDRANDRLKIYNMLANLCVSSEMYNDAIIFYNKILSIVPKSDRPKILKQIGFCHFKANDFENATLSLKQVLSQNPKDETAKKWLEALQQAKSTGTYNQLESVFGNPDLLGELTSSISQFLEFYLERCTYEGVGDAKIASRNFSDEDLNKLRGLIEGAGRTRSGLRAQYSLSSAKLLMDLEAGDEKRFRQHLQQYTIDMGNASLAEQKPREVAIAYYFEGFAISPEISSRLREVLSKLMMLTNVQDLDLILAEKLPSFPEAFQQALKARPKPVVEILLELSALNNSVRVLALTEILRNENTKKIVQDSCSDLVGETQAHTLESQEFLKLWDRGIAYIRHKNNQVEDDFTYLLSLSLLDTLPEHIKRIGVLGENSRWSLDRDRLRKIAEVLQHVYDYIQQQSYVERERLATIIKNRTQDFTEEIANSPTKNSLELYWPYLQFIQKTIDDHFIKVQQAAEPDRLDCNLSIESYIPDKDDYIICQITVTNLSEKSPASSISIQVLNSPNNEYILSDKNFPLSEALPGGKSITCQIPLRVTEKATSSKVFTLYYSVNFTTRMGKRIEMVNQILPVRLYPGSIFEKIHNPYATYAEGGPVEDSTMFFGRGELLSRLKSTIENSSNNKSLVIYGQKRTGKSSVIIHLMRLLDSNQFIPVYFSIGEIIQEFTFAHFLYKILQSLQDTLDDLSSLKGKPEVRIERPSIDEFSSVSFAQIEAKRL